MPARGSFSLSLVDADSLDPLREYGECLSSVSWVKGEGGDEFFVVLRCEQYNSTKCFVEVDGKDLGYTWISHSPGTSEPLGPIKGGQTARAGSTDLVTHAFRFVRESRSEEHKPSSFGTVKATWFACEREGDDDAVTLDGWDEDDTFDSSLRASTGAMPGSLPKVCTGSWVTRDEMCSLSINYTTEIGLAVRGLTNVPHKRTADEDDVVEVKKLKKDDTEDEDKSLKDDEVVDVTKDEVEYRVTTDSDGKEVIELD